MSTYRVSVNVGTTVFVIVEADDEDTAFTEAAEALPQMCAMCSGWGHDSWGRDEWEPDWDKAEIESA
jgi:hypothetical protein